MFDAWSLMSIALVGAGMFFLGWYTHAWLATPRREAEASQPAVSRWCCPQCNRVRELPPELDAKVLVCNNCQVRLRREVAEAR